jgi:hypothetical protein
MGHCSGQESVTVTWTGGRSYTWFFKDMGTWWNVNHFSNWNQNTGSINIAFN